MLRIFVTKYNERRQGSKFSVKTRAVFLKDLLNDAIRQNRVVKERLFRDAPVSQETSKKDRYDACALGEKGLEHEIYVLLGDASRGLGLGHTPVPEDARVER